jgi:transcriptional regulator GlxA family with amidase domain
MVGVAVVAFDRISIFELSVACEVFGLDRSDMGLPNYRFWVCAAEPPPLRTNGGMTLRPGQGLSSLTEADTIVVPAWRDIDEPPPARLLAVLRRAHHRGARIASFCSGAFVLAAAGLLDGRRATTHWMYAAELARRFPAIQVDPSVLYVDEGSVLTSAGTAAAIDLCLHMVRRDHGAQVANAFARRMVVAPHRGGGQSQYVEAPVAAAGGPDGVGQAMEWALRHLDRPLTVECLAGRAHMSARTFARRFRAVTGTTPLQWLLQQRVFTAQQLLEGTELSVEEVAERCGFGSATALRLHFERRFGVPPTVHRAHFRAHLRPASRLVTSA